MKNDLMSRMLKTSTIEETSTLDNSVFFKSEDIKTDIPILNAAFSGDLNGGFSEGITMICGESKTYKTGLLVQLALAHQRKYKDGIVVLFDSEFSPIEYYEDAGVDMSRVLHIPIKHIEELKFEAMIQLENLKRDDNVIVIVDSIGGLASKKEVQDALSGSDKSDMTRPKQLASFFRMITPLVNMKGIPFIMINSHYTTLEMFSKNVTGGGMKPYLASDNVFFITRAQDKDGKVLKGYYFTITADKSRKIKEKSKFILHITSEHGIDKYSGLFELAIESGLVIQSAAWYQTFDPETGELIEKKKRRSDIETDEFFESLLKNDKFNEFVKDKYLLNG